MSCFKIRLASFPFAVHGCVWSFGSDLQWTFLVNDSKKRRQNRASLSETFDTYPSTEVCTDSLFWAAPEKALWQQTRWKLHYVAHQQLPLCRYQLRLLTCHRRRRSREAREARHWSRYTLLIKTMNRHVSNQNWYRRVYYKFEKPERILRKFTSVMLVNYWKLQMPFQPTYSHFFVIILRDCNEF